jgi:hypothetical protein
MSTKRNKIIGWFASLTIFLGCREVNLKEERSVPVSSSVVASAVDKSKIDTLFSNLYKEILDTSISDEKNFDILQKTFFSVPHPAQSAYCFYFRFIQFNRDASLSEEASINSFIMWKENKEKCVKLLACVNSLPMDTRKSIQKSLVQVMCLDLNANNYNLQLFRKDFPSLTDSVSLASAKECFENWVE